MWKSGVLCDIKHEHDDQGEGVQDNGKSGTGIWGRHMGIEDGTHRERNWTSQTCECYDGCAELRSWTGLEIK